MPVERHASRHASVRPTREDIVGEVVYSERWRELASRPAEWSDEPDDDMLATAIGGIVGRPDARDATVVASIAQWLGTNAGSAFLHMAAALRGAGPGFPGGATNAHHLAWCATNARRWGIRGRRALESILLPEATGPGMSGTVPAVGGLPPVTLRDHEVAEAWAMWLGSPDGAAFLEGCSAEIAIRVDAARHHRRPRVPA